MLCAIAVRCLLGLTSDYDFQKKFIVAHFVLVCYYRLLYLQITLLQTEDSFAVLAYLSEGFLRTSFNNCSTDSLTYLPNFQ